MKSARKWLTLILAAVLALSLSVPALAMETNAGPAEIAGAFLELLNRDGAAYADRGFDSEGDYEITIFYPGDNRREHEVRLYIAADGKSYSAYEWYLLEYDSTRLPDVLEVLNDLNARYRFATFLADTGDNTVTAEYHGVLGGDASFSARVLYYAYSSLPLAVDKAWPELTERIPTSAGKTPGKKPQKGSPGGNDPAGPVAAEPETPGEINVPGIEERTLSVDPITPHVISVEGAEILYYTGQITKEDQRDRYTLRTPREGRYRVEISGMQAGTSVELIVLNTLGERVATDGYCVNGDGVTLKGLPAGETYEIQVNQDNGLSSYNMLIGIQKPTVDISDVTELTDSVEYTDQRNVYSFTVPRDGRYRFEISGMMSGTNVELLVLNSLGETVASDGYCVNGDGVTVRDLKAGEVYTVQVRQDNELGGYTLHIGQQKETVDISELTLLTDSVEYTDQRNVYSFTVPRDGCYRFEISGMMSGTDVELYVFDSLGETVASDGYCVNGDGVTVRGLVAGDYYNVQVRQDNGLSKYALFIGQQKETVDVRIGNVVNDSIEYTDQRNVYSFTADSSEDLLLQLSGMKNGMNVELYVFNDLGETVTYDSYCVNGDTLKVKDVSAGTHYEIQVRQDTGTGDYTLTIG